MSGFLFCLHQVYDIFGPSLCVDFESWPGLFGQESALDKWILCRLSSRGADFSASSLRPTGGRPSMRDQPTLGLALAAPVR